MKATGITRPVDELGRIVIPKELRKTFGISAGDSMEILTDSDDRIVLQKYQPGCIFCRGLEGLESFRGVDVCAECRLALKTPPGHRQPKAARD